MFRNAYCYPIDINITNKNVQKTIYKIIPSRVGLVEPVQGIISLCELTFCMVNVLIISIALIN